MRVASILDLLTALVLAPLLPGLIARVKAIIAGRQGPPLLQTYYDLIKLLRKGAVYSDTTSWLFRAGPVASLACILTALALVPVGARSAPLAFTADFVMLAYLLAVGRFLTVAAALDTGSSFEGMGGSREVHFAALGEPALLLGLITLARQTGTLSLSPLATQTSPLVPEVALVGAALLIILLCENARMPFDDPNTHLELTMVHEVMVLDHSGPDLAYIIYGSCLKLWLWGLLVVDVLAPRGWKTALPSLTTLAGLFGLMIVIGLIESTVARLRLVRVPQLLATATALAAIAFILVIR